MRYADFKNIHDIAKEP